MKKITFTKHILIALVLLTAIGIPSIAWRNIQISLARNTESHGNRQYRQDKKQNVRKVSVLRDYPSRSLAYNITESSLFKTDPKIQEIVDDVVKQLKSKRFPTSALSISLIQLDENPCCKYGSYADKQPRFPASVAKFFWMVAFYGQVEQGFLSESSLPPQDMYKMIQKSDNESASRVLDKITGTESGSDLNYEMLGIWSAKRKWVNHYFEQAGYTNIDISQKNFPIPYLKLAEPEGRDLQIRGKNSSPRRNFLTTFDAAKLLFEIHTRQSVSAKYSRKMEELLLRDLHPEAWQHEQYNSIEGFLGEALSPETYFASKVGWTSFSRQEVALIQSPDGKTKYILAIFGDDKSYANDWEIFPEISRQIYNKMVATSRT